MLMELLLLVVMAVYLPGSTGPEDAPPRSSASEPARERSTAPLDGLWPSKKLMSSLLHRWADGVMEGYELDDQTRADLRDAMARRWRRFLNDNRTAIQPLLNEFVEMRVALNPPSKQSVQAWAQRAIPLFDQLQQQLNDGLDEFRESLDPVQQAKFESEVLELGLGVRDAKRKLEQWKDGNVDVEEFWTKPNAERRRRRQERRQAQSRDRKGADRAHRAAGGMEARLAGSPRGDPNSNAKELRPETDQIALELQAWEQYVKEFIQNYNLDEGQRTATLSCLSELKQRAGAHRDSRRAEINKLEYRIRNNTGTDKELAEIKQQLIEQYGPIDEMFQELQHRLDLIPTAKQQAAAQALKQNE